MPKIKKRRAGAVLRKLLSTAAVSAAALLILGAFPYAEVAAAASGPQGGTNVSEAAESTDHEALHSFEPSVSRYEYGALDDRWREILLSYAAAGSENDVHREACTGELISNLESLAVYPLEDYPSSDGIYRLYAAACETDVAIGEADAFQQNCTLVCSVFGELAKMKNGCVFTRQEKTEYAESVLRAADEMRAFMNSPRADCLKETLIMKNREELYAAAREAAQFLIERMDALEGEAGPCQHILYRYALGGGWAEHDCPDWLSTDCLFRLGEILKKEALDRLYDDPEGILLGESAAPDIYDVHME